MPLSEDCWSDAFIGPVAVEQGGDQTDMLVGELAGAVLGAGLGEPGADPDGVAVEADALTGGGDAAFAVQEEFQGHRQLEGVSRIWDDRRVC